MIPIGDYAGIRQRFPYINIALIVANVLVFLYELTLPDAGLERFFAAWGVVPREITTGTDLAPTIALPIYVTLLTSMFMHGGWLHLGGNMLFLWVFGDNVENAFGSLKYLLFYLICGIAGAVAQIAIAPSSQVPTIGASGAISGVLGAYILMFPRAMVRTVIFIFFFFTVTYIPAILYIGIWFLMQFLQGLTLLGPPTANNNDGVAFWAHIGGFVAGLFLALLLRRRDFRAATPRIYSRY